MKRIFLIIFLVFLFFYLIPSQVKAAGLVPCGGFTDRIETIPLVGGVPTVPTGWRKISDTEMAELEPVCEFCHIFVLFKNIFDFLIIPSAGNPMPIVLIIAVLMIVIGGCMFMFAYTGGAEVLPGGAKGGPAMLNQAKRLITSVIFGLLIIYGAWLMVNFVLTFSGLVRTNLGWWNPAEWFQINCP